MDKRRLVPAPQFDSLEFLCRWIFLPIPALNAFLVPAAA